RVRGIRHRRIQPLAVRADALAQGIAELLLGVVADAGRGRRRDVGGDDVADRREHGQTAGERFAPGHGMAGHAVAGGGQVLAALQQCGVGAVGGMDRRRGEQAEQQQAAGRYVHARLASWPLCMVPACVFFAGKMCSAVRSASATPVSVEFIVAAVGITPVLQTNRFSWSCVRPNASTTEVAGSLPMLIVPVMCWLLANWPSAL